MEYVFGTVYRNGIEVQNLKTSGEEHSNLSGYCHIQRDYPDNTITDTFRVVEKYQTDELSDGRKLDWYVIEEHNRYMDRFTPVQEKIETDIADSQDAICVLSEDMEQRLADLEDALCEITKEE